MATTISKSEAARRKDCSVHGISSGIERGELNADEGKVVADRKFLKWTPRRQGRSPKDDAQTWTLRAGMNKSQKARFMKKVRRGEDYAEAARRILCG